MRVAHHRKENSWWLYCKYTVSWVLWLKLSWLKGIPGHNRTCCHITAHNAKSQQSKVLLLADWSLIKSQKYKIFLIFLSHLLFKCILSWQIHRPYAVSTLSWSLDSVQTLFLLLFFPQKWDNWTTLLHDGVYCKITFEPYRIKTLNLEDRETNVWNNTVIVLQCNLLA